MGFHQKPVKVLRFWYRISTQPNVEALSHTSFRWLYGLVMQWSGMNNGIIEFTRRRHGARYGLEHREVFERAREEVLQTGLVERTRKGGPH